MLVVFLHNNNFRLKFPSSFKSLGKKENSKIKGFAFFVIPRLVLKILIPFFINNVLSRVLEQKVSKKASLFNSANLKDYDTYF